VCGDGEYIVYTALAWRNKSFGSATDFVWSPDSNDFAVREAGNKVKIFKNFAVGGRAGGAARRGAGQSMPGMAGACVSPPVHLREAAADPLAHS
jgi:hypothetical protein